MGPSGEPAVGARNLTGSTAGSWRALLAAAVFLAVALLTVLAGGTSGPTELEPGEDLSGDRSVESQDGRYKLTMADSGRLILEDEKGEEVWSPPRTPAARGALARFRENGEFVVLAQDELTELFTTGTDDTNADSLTVTNSGRVRLTDSADDILWDSAGIASVIHAEQPEQSDEMRPWEALRNGQYLESPNGSYRLELDKGELVLQQGNKPLALLARAPEDAALAMQHDGNLVLYEHPDEPHGRAVWSTRTKGLGVDGLALRNDGTLVLHGPSGDVCSVYSPRGVGSDAACPAQTWIAR